MEEEIEKLRKIINYMLDDLDLQKKRCGSVSVTEVLNAADAVSQLERLLRITHSERDNQPKSGGLISQAEFARHMKEYEKQSRRKK